MLQATRLLLLRGGGGGRRGAPLSRRLFSTHERSIKSLPSSSSSHTALKPYLIHQAKVWSKVSKLQLSAMVVLSSSCGFLLAGPSFDLHKLACVTVGCSLAAASASAFNQIYEKPTDLKMLRTRHRPIPAGIVSRRGAAKFAMGSMLSSFGILYMGTDPITCGLGMFTIFLYSAVYTPLKQHSEWNTWVGAVVGAVPPLMGYTAATGGVLDSSALLLGTGLFLWQFPHFFALAWLLRKDYARGGHQMVSVNDPTGARTAKVMWNYSAALSAVPALAYLTDATGIMFPLESLAFNGYLLYTCNLYAKETSDENARRVFRTSLWYLPVFMGLFVFHSKKDRRAEEGNSESWARWRNYELTTLDLMRASMKDLCVHEWALQRQASTPCPKVEIDQVKLMSCIAGTEFPP